MKRSEMIIDISIELMGRLPEWEKQERLNFAEEILQCIEMNGMLPPEVDPIPPHIIDDCKSANYWEPEDE